MTETIGGSIDVISGTALAFGAIVVCCSLVSALLTVVAIARAML